MEKSSSSWCIGCYGKNTDGGHWYFWGLGCYSVLKNTYSDRKIFCCCLPISVLYSETNVSDSYKSMYYSLCCGLYSKQSNGLQRNVAKTEKTENTTVENTIQIENVGQSK
jgi:hypothetical protein